LQFSRICFKRNQIFKEEFGYVKNLRDMWQETDEGPQGQSCKQQEHEDLVPQPSENPLHRRQVGRGEAREGLYPVHPLGFSQKGRLKRDDLETIAGRGGWIRLLRLLQFDLTEGPWSGSPVSSNPKA
jgi:hypothetical protein